MRKLLISLSAPLALLASPALAQPAEDELAALGQIFAPPEPLTAEQQGRLPAARALIERIIPPGSLGEVMGGMFDTMLSPMMQMGVDDPASAVAEGLGSSGYAMDLSPENAAEAAAILDPAWAERRQVQMALVPQLMARMMAGIEPVMKNVMAELYAINFTARELADIDAFFATPSGAAYARRSLAMGSDPRMAGAMMQAMPSMFEGMATLEAELAAATAHLPAPRSYDDLSLAQRSRLSALTGLSKNEIEAGMASRQPLEASEGW